ncbi:MAG: L,D-transpeptidase family protein [Selenomonadaceae bacterium]|nr:L,D-transpeptidase family protein [Selenomonadaceae bacterium]
MRKLFSALVLLLSFIFVGQVSAQSFSETPQWVKDLPAAKNAKQLFVVAGMGGTTAWISMHEKDANGNWRQIITTPGFVGKGGIGKTKEGDNKTPVGTFVIDKAFGIAPDPGCAMPYTQVDENIYWSGDANYKYNQWVDIRENPNLNKDDSEHIVYYNPHYMYVLNIGYNKECTPGKGSALFIHCFGPAKPWTGGCVSLPEEKMKTVMQNIKPGCVAVIDSAENLGAKY